MYLTNRFYIVFVLVILFLGSGYAFAPLFVVGQWAFVALIALVSADGFLLYRTNAIQAERHCADRFSNGDENEVAIRVDNSYPRPVSLEIIDEIPFIFQQRNINFRIQLQANEGKTISYRLRPTQRGVYSFGQMCIRDRLNETTGTSDGANGSMTEGYIYLFNDPIKEGKGWLEKYYLYQVPLEEIALNPNLTQNPGWDKE